MYDIVSFDNANLRLMKHNLKNKGATLEGTGDRLSWTIFLHFFAAYIKAAAYVRPRPITPFRMHCILTKDCILNNSKLCEELQLIAGGLRRLHLLFSRMQFRINLFFGY